jgi:hypothetical protein
MANVLLGIVGIVLFIGLSLAGASYFGPLTSDALTEARASGLIQILSTTAKAVNVRNREQETMTASSANSSELTPDFLDETPVNPVTAGPVLLVTDAGVSSSGVARFVASKLPTDQADMCSYINRQGGGSATVPSVTTIPQQVTGCARANAAMGAFATGDYIAYMSIN